MWDLAAVKMKSTKIFLRWIFVCGYFLTNNEPYLTSVKLEKTIQFIFTPIFLSKFGFSADNITNWAHVVPIMFA